MNSHLLSVLLGAMMVALGLGPAALGEMVDIHPSQDNSIYSENGSNSNALGSLFAGRNNSAGLNLRRALIQFDIAGSGIPVGAIINSVSLGLFQQKHASNSSLETFELHPVLAAWGEGTSIGAGSGGPATAGDATLDSPSFLFRALDITWR